MTDVYIELVGQQQYFHAVTENNKHINILISFDECISRGGGGGGGGVSGGKRRRCGVHCTFQKEAKETVSLGWCLVDTNQKHQHHLCSHIGRHQPKYWEMYIPTVSFYFILFIH